MFVEDDSYFQDDAVALAPLDPEWQPILHASNQVVLYNPTSHALSVQRHSSSSTPTGLLRRNSRLRSLQCPYCHRSIPHEDMDDIDADDDEDFESDFDDHPRSRAPNYFQLLQISNEAASVPPTPLSSTPGRNITPLAHEDGTNEEKPFSATNMAEGYFEAFFQEECRLGMGANGSVYLCRHVLNGNPLGHFAVKKIAVGQSHSYLLNTLREVRLLEKLHHPNIITYHHAWLETCQFSSFGPKVPTLHVLMQWAEGGSLDDFIDARLGKLSATPFHHVHPSSTASHSTQERRNNDLDTSQSASSPYSRGARIRAFRAMQHAPPEERERLRRELEGEGPSRSSGRTQPDLKAVHLLSAEEIKSLFKDVVEGLAFLHENSILHLDLKPGNVLLTWDEGKLIPRAMLSDFGTSQDMLNARVRSGNTGTLEYVSPESLPSPTGQLTQIDSKADMWSLGMVLHKLLFFRLPYRYASDSPRSDTRKDGKEIADLLEQEVHQYSGFKSNQTLATAFDSRHLPRAILVLLEGLLNIRPSARPSSERVLVAIREGKLDPVPRKSASSSTLNALKTSLVPMRYRRDNQTATSQDGTSELPPWPDTEGAGSSHSGGEADKNSVRGLPAPPHSPAPTTPPWATLKVWNRLYTLDSRSSRVIARRSIKSCLLVYKVWTLFSMYMAATIRPPLLLYALGLAIMDTWFDGLTESLVLGLAHLGLVRYAYWQNR